MLETKNIFTFARIAPELNTIKYSQNLSSWSLENGYQNPKNQTSYPIRVFNAKGSSSLAIYIRMFEKDFEYNCRGMVPGVRIFLHTPGDTMPSTRHSFRIPLSEEIQISIQPILTSTCKNLQRYTPEQRQCFFNSERKLYFFKNYTQNNCEVECLSNYTLLSCQCVKFSMPSKFTTNFYFFYDNF